MQTIYIVKSFGNQGYINLKVFSDNAKAIEFANTIQAQIPESATNDEWVVVESILIHESMTLADND